VENLLPYLRLGRGFSGRFRRSGLRYTESGADLGKGDGSAAPEKRLRGGGYVFTPVHNIQANVPVENILAMFEEIRAFNGEKG